MKDTWMPVDDHLLEKLEKLARDAMAQPKQKRAEPFADPFLAEILDDFDLKLQRFKAATKLPQAESKQTRDEQMELVFRLCEHSRDALLRIWPPTYTPQRQLERAISSFREAVGAIKDYFGSADEHVNKFCDNMTQRAKELEEALAGLRRL